MWGNPPFFIPDGYAVDVRDLAAARSWYKEKLGLRDSKKDRQDDSGQPFVDMCVSERDETFIALVELEPGATPQKNHVIFYARKLEKAHQWLKERGVVVEPMTIDSGGNHYFLFRDLDENAIEVCVEPG